MKGFFDIIHLFKHGGIKKIFNTLVSTVKNLPHILGEVVTRLHEFVVEVFSLAGSTILDEIKHVVNHLRQFVDGIKHDILKFYHVSVFLLILFSLSEIFLTRLIYYADSSVVLIYVFLLK